MGHHGRGGARIVLGVTGGIAAYKACALLRRLCEDGHAVTVVPTTAALRFVGEATWAALSGRPVAVDVWDDVHEVPHVRLGQQADLVVVAPATADLLARAAHGLADDLLTNTLLTARCPVVMAPAMHTEMWLHPATQANVATLRARGVQVLDPAEGRLTGADSGPGRLPEPEDIHAACLPYLSAITLSRDTGDVAAPQCPLAGYHVVVSAGGTREALDPVRYLGNRSSGKQGYALADVALALGARVSLVSANVELPAPPGATLVQVESARQLQDALRQAADQADVIVMAAAVADFRPAQYATSKIKKGHDAGQEQQAPTIHLVRNPDILAGLVSQRRERGTPKPLIVGFAAETGDEAGDVLDHARAKLARKGCDLLVANQVGSDLVFGQDRTTVHILTSGTDAVATFGPVTKHEAAHHIWQAVLARLEATRQE